MKNLIIITLSLVTVSMVVLADDPRPRPSPYVILDIPAKALCDAKISMGYFVQRDTAFKTVSHAVDDQYKKSCENSEGKTAWDISRDVTRSCQQSCLVTSFPVGKVAERASPKQCEDYCMPVTTAIHDYMTGYSDGKWGCGAPAPPPPITIVQVDNSPFTSLILTIKSNESGKKNNHIYASGLISTEGPRFQEDRLFSQF